MLASSISWHQGWGSRLLLDPGLVQPTMSRRIDLDLVEPATYVDCEPDAGRPGLVFWPHYAAVPPSLAQRNSIVLNRRRLLTVVALVAGMVLPNAVAFA